MSQDRCGAFKKNEGLLQNIVFNYLDSGSN